MRVLDFTLVCEVRLTTGRRVLNGRMVPEQVDGGRRRMGRALCPHGQVGDAVQGGLQVVAQVVGCRPRFRRSAARYDGSRPL